MDAIQGVIREALFPQKIAFFSHDFFEDKDNDYKNTMPLQNQQGKLTKSYDHIFRPANPQKSAVRQDEAEYRFQKQGRYERNLPRDAPPTTLQ